MRNMIGMVNYGLVATIDMKPKQMVFYCVRDAIGYSVLQRPSAQCAAI
jgi:hypothetical protein